MQAKATRHAETYPQAHTNTVYMNHTQYTHKWNYPLPNKQSFGGLMRTQVWRTHTCRLTQTHSHCFLQLTVILLFFKRDNTVRRELSTNISCNKLLKTCSLLVQSCTCQGNGTDLRLNWLKWNVCFLFIYRLCRYKAIAVGLFYNCSALFI